MVYISEKNKLFLVRLAFLIIIILKFKIISNVDVIFSDHVKERCVFPTNNISMDSFIKNNSNSNVLVVYGGYQSGKTYITDQIKKELINESYVSYPLKINCNGSSVSNRSIEVFVNYDQTSLNKNKKENQKIRQKIEQLLSTFNESKSQNITYLLENVGSTNKIFVAIPEFNENETNYINLTKEKLNEFENVSFIIESTDYNFLITNNSNITVIETKPINNSSLFLSKQNKILSNKEAKIVEELFDGNIGPIIRIVNDVQNGKKFNDSVSNVEKEIQDNLTILTNDFNSTNDFLNLCNSSIELSNVNLSQLNTINYLFEKGLLYVNESHFINFANPTVKKFLCQKKLLNSTEDELNSTKIQLNETSIINATEINETENLVNLTSKQIDQNINLTVNETNINKTDSLNNLTTEYINETENMFNLTSKAVNETENLGNLTAESINETVNLTSQAINETANLNNITTESINETVNETANLNNIKAESINETVNETANLNNIKAESINETVNETANLNNIKAESINETENLASQEVNETANLNNIKAESINETENLASQKVDETKDAEDTKDLQDDASKATDESKTENKEPNISEKDTSESKSSNTTDVN